MSITQQLETIAQQLETIAATMGRLETVSAKSGVAIRAILSSAPDVALQMLIDRDVRHMAGIARQIMDARQ